MSATVEVAVSGDDRAALRALSDVLARPGRLDTRELDQVLDDAGYSREAIGQLLGELVSHEDDCPDCPLGVVEPVGSQDGETGFTPAACSQRCGYVA